MARWEGRTRNMRDPLRRRRQPPPGQAWPRRESEGLIVPLRPVKAGGGKEPWFWNAFEEGETKEIGKPRNS